MRQTCVAAVRFSATPPALRLMRNTLVSWSVLNWSMILARASSDMEPCSLTHLVPVCSCARWGAGGQSEFERVGTSIARIYVDVERRLPGETA